MDSLQYAPRQGTPRLLGKQIRTGLNIFCQSSLNEMHKQYKDKQYKEYDEHLYTFVKVAGRVFFTLLLTYVMASLK